MIGSILLWLGKLTALFAVFEKKDKK